MVLFDTLKLAQKLQADGVPREQAGAFVRAMADVVSDLVSERQGSSSSGTSMTTFNRRQDDLKALRLRVARLEGIVYALGFWVLLLFIKAFLLR